MDFSNNRSCCICKRDTTTLELKKSGNFDVCSTCKNHFYTHFNKLFMKVVESASLQNEDTFSQQNTFSVIWNYLNSKNNCQSKSDFTDLTKICKIDYQSQPIKNCSKCRFRLAILMFQLPNTKATLTYKDEFLIFSKMWPILKKMLVEQCDNIKDSSMIMVVELVHF